MDESSEASAVDRTRAPRPTRQWKPAPPRSVVGLASLAVLVAAAAVLSAVWTAGSIREALDSLSADTAWVNVGLYSVAALAMVLFVPAVKGLQTAIEARRLIRIDLAEARATTADAQEKSRLAIGYAVAFAIVLLFGLFLIANEIAVGKTFFDLGLIFETGALVASAFWVNVEIFMIAEVLVLVWGLLIAVARLAPGRAGAPIRLIATAYVDLFRGLPAIIAIYLVGFGLPLTDLPILRDMTPTMFAILALTLTYGAYVSEVYRSGIESVHWSQTAAARSLGFSHSQTLRYVVVPQAVRRIIPPLLNDFISLQKDTALVSVIGTVDAFNQAKIIASNHFNLSSVTTVAVLFVLITIPQARLVDKLIERDQKRMRAGG
ncbi:amino acid ABC transporter permease [Siculibacillus lacustris]|uniref:Amino acid ABC transporter permease n=1 Tax=Siculibacillus lacustris TaxID=1549641 RepID=A0A4Q9VUY1_9HYPH|nr:amino acid ABC transporter permease [Siculibacillus lacustris]TBW40018.1 amino acid ABC transporter permease [Siculibacillus lacustris]